MAINRINVRVNGCFEDEVVAPEVSEAMADLTMRRLYDDQRLDNPD